MSERSSGRRSARLEPNKHNGAIVCKPLCHVRTDGVTVELRQKKQKNRLKRKKRIRGRIVGTNDRPRMSIFKTLKHSYVQLIDDTGQKPLLGVSTLNKEMKSALHDKTGNVDAARKLGNLVAEKALEKNITRVIFDRNGFLYHGRVKAIAEGAREKGLQF